MNELYQKQILALARSARQGFSVAAPTHSCQLKNPVCGDEVILQMRLEDGIIKACDAQVQGCALCEAGAGLFLTMVSGKTQQDLVELNEKLSAFLTSSDDAHSQFSAFTPIRDVKNRHKCVMLAFTASTHLKAIDAI